MGPTFASSRTAGSLLALPKCNRTAPALIVARGVLEEMSSQSANLPVADPTQAVVFIMITEWTPPVCDAQRTEPVPPNRQRAFPDNRDSGISASRSIASSIHVNAQVTLRRRSVIAVAISGGAAWFGGHAPLLVTSREQAALACDSAGLLSWCLRLNHPRPLGKACLEALPGIETSIASLTRLILDGMRATGGDRWSARALARAIRERGRDDFREGRIVNVDGWMLSLTETRVYALAALLSQPRRTVE